MNRGNVDERRKNTFQRGMETHVSLARNLSDTLIQSDKEIN